MVQAIINVLAKSAPAIIAATALVAILGYITSNNVALLDFADGAIKLAVVAVIIIAALIHGPRFMR